MSAARALALFLDHYKRYNEVVWALGGFRRNSIQKCRLPLQFYLRPTRADGVADFILAETVDLSVHRRSRGTALLCRDLGLGNNAGQGPCRVDGRGGLARYRRKAGRAQIPSASATCWSPLRRRALFRGASDVYHRWLADTRPPSRSHSEPQRLASVLPAALPRGRGH